MSLKWRQGDYFRLLLEEDSKSYALEMLVDDLHRDKKNTVNAFLAHFGSEDFIWGLVRLLASENSRTAGNAAYILGTLAEQDTGQSRVLGLVNGSYPHKILADLTDMLSFDDAESVMNAAGTIGTLADSPAGREWILREPYFDKMVKKVSNLLNSENMWTASNAALVLARLVIAEDGCQRILNHSNSLRILTKLIDSLGLDEAGRGMNAAFAIGRLCDTDEGQKRLLFHESSEKMIDNLCVMLSGKDSGCSKNSCYALSCLAANDEGHKRLLDHNKSDAMIHLLANQLANEEGETGWFAAMTLRTLASKRRGVMRLRDHPDVIPQLKATQMMLGIHEELKDEVNLTYELLRSLDKPDPPNLEVKGANQVEVTWSEVHLMSGQEVTYRLFCERELIYKGTSLSHTATGLRPNTQYGFWIALSTESDDSPMSEVVYAHTEESVPDPPEGLRLLNATTSQLKLSWAPPTLNNAHIKGYMVYNGKQLVETTTELNSIVSGLSPTTSYELSVCAINHKGRGLKASITARTVELGKHAPSKPSLTVLGRSEIQVTWAPPDNPLGRLHRFELTLNGKVIYSGRDLSYNVRRLTPATDYVFTVIAVTSEGKCESDPAKKRTPKEEYRVQSTAQRYFTHPSKPGEQESAGKMKEKLSTKTSRKSSSATKPPRALSGSSHSLDSRSRPHSASSSKKSGHSNRRKSSIQERHIKLPIGSVLPGVVYDQSCYQRDQVLRNGLSKSNNRTIEVMKNHLSNSPRGANSVDDNNNSKNHNLRSFNNNKQRTREGIILPQVREDTSEQFITGYGDHVRKATLRESNSNGHIVDKFPYDPNACAVGGRDAHRKSFPARRNPQLTSEFSRRSIGSFLAAVETKTMDSLQERRGNSSQRSRANNGKQMKKNNAPGKFSPSLPQAISKEPMVGEISLTHQRKVSPTDEDENFRIYSQGVMVYEESRKNHSDRRSPGRNRPSRILSPARKGLTQDSSSPRWRVEDEGKETESGLYDDFTSWCRDGNISDVDLDSDENLPPSKNSSAKRKSAHANRNPLAEPAIPSRSALANPNSFYQRTNTFLSSHRPSIKKNLSKLHGHYDLEVPPQRLMTSNRYQFVPTQLRTQAISMPGPPYYGGNRLAALQDKKGALI
ncbi:uncharacterized protein [Apostichopus japonicus]|uniref:uncharacterized protein isoform X2 n=1 Tax=Stichopus japonicus TaxID=307972 RepID=UPI003AB768AB